MSFIRFDYAMHHPSLTILLPVYNEASRIVRGIDGARLLRDRLQSHYLVRILVVDDGSTDGSTDSLPNDVELLRLPHLGKGATVRTGLAHSTTDWTIFTDIDWSVPMETVYQLVMDTLKTPSDIVIASREINGATRIAEPPWRHLLGKLFNRWVQWILLAGYMDTQCGCKMLHHSAIDVVVPLMQENGWAFDVELLLIANLKGITVTEFAVPWVYRSQSKVRLWRDGMQMAQAVWRMKQRLNLNNFEEK